MWLCRTRLDRFTRQQVQLTEGSAGTAALLCFKMAELGPAADRKPQLLPTFSVSSPTEVPFPPAAQQGRSHIVFYELIAMEGAHLLEFFQKTILSL